MEFVTAEKSIFEMPVCFAKSRKLEEAFDNGNKNVVLYSKIPSFAAECALNFALGKNSKFSKVIYARFDRHEYLYTKTMKPHSIDTVLKSCLCRPFVLDDCNTKKCSAENYLLCFENAADKNTLVIIDNFDIAAPSPYMRHLFSLDCGVLVITDKDMKSLPNEVLLITESGEDCFECCFDVLNDSQKELLMTLCAMLEYLDDSIPILSSESGVFDKDSVRFYLGSLCDELDVLERCGFVRVLDSERVLIEKEVRKLVFAKLSPNAENCRTFMKFVKERCGFRILQNVKDISASLYAAEDDYDVFASSLEFMSVYTHFSQSDKDRGIRLYNMLVSHMLENTSMQNGTFYKWHLVFKNMPYFVSVLSECLVTEDTAEKIYDDELYMDEPLSDIYTNQIKANLDIIRLCLSFVRNMTADMYKTNEYVFEKLHASMRDIFDYVQDISFDNESKMALLDDVIRLCSESFDYFYAIDKDGIYYPKHDSFDKRRIFYNCERESDRLYADSIPFGYSDLIVKLYEIYGKFLSEWVKLSYETNLNHNNNLLKQIHEEKICEREKTLEAIKAHFCRIILGYENFADIYEQKSLKTCEITQIPRKRLQDNKRFLRRGFDGGTIKGAERYTDSIINVIKESRAPLRIALTVLNPSYPLSEDSYIFLLKKNFAQHLCRNKNMPNFSLQILLESLVCDYDACFAKCGRRTLYEDMISYISNNVNITETFLERMYHAVSSMYVRVKNGILLQTGKLDSEGFCDVLYDRYCSNENQRPKFCDDYIAKAIYSKLSDGGKRVNKNLIINAVRTHNYENGNYSGETDKLIEFLIT